MKKTLLIALLFASSFIEAQMTQIVVTSVRRYPTYAEISYKMRFTLPAVYGTGSNPIQGLNAIVSSYDGYGTEVIPVTGTIITYTKTQSVGLSTTQTQIQTGLTDIYTAKRAELDAIALSPFDNLAGLSYNGSWSSSSTITDAPLSELNSAVTATAATGVAVTLTLPAVNGRFHIIKQISITAYSTAARTGSATPIIVTSTNLPGSMAWTFSTASAIGATDIKLEQALSLRSSVANTSTTIVCPATTGIIWRVTILYTTTN